ncbi:MAG TPA: hypothetical protein EYP33_01100 [Pyrodictium sp.]|nr:hypothetical protein [Pyrodictium sp.]
MRRVLIRVREKLAGFRDAAAAAMVVAQTSVSASGYETVGAVVEIFVSVALPALILISIVKMIMNHIRA